MTVSEWKCGETGGLTRSPVFKGPDDLNGNGYFYVRLCWTGEGLQANFDEEYVLLCAMLLCLCWFEATVRPDTV